MSEETPQFLTPIRCPYCAFTDGVHAKDCVRPRVNWSKKMQDTSARALAWFNASSDEEKAETLVLLSKIATPRSPLVDWLGMAGKPGPFIPTAFHNPAGDSIEMWWEDVAYYAEELPEGSLSLYRAFDDHHVVGVRIGKVKRLVSPPEAP